MLRSAMDREPTEQDSYSRMLATVNSELQNLPDPKTSDIKADINDAAAERELVRRQIKAADELGPQQFLIDQSEGSRAFYETTPEGVVIEETLEIRPGRKAIDVVGGKGGGRSTAEFTAGQQEPDVVRQVRGVRMRDYDDAGNQKTAYQDDRTVQAKKTIYGIQTPNEEISAGLSPSRIPQSSVVEEGLRQSVAAPEGDVPIPPPEETLFTRSQPQRSQDPLKASEAIRRARIEGDRRDPQSILRAMGFGV
jgi:hypothetical protein